MRIDQIEFLRKEFDKAYWKLFQKSNSSNQSTAMAENIVGIRSGLADMASIFGSALKVIEDDMKVKDIPNIPIQEIPSVLTKEHEHTMAQHYGVADGIPKNRDWVISYCIETLLRSNKRLREYTPSNPETQEVVSRLASEMQTQNNVLMTALRHLMEKTDE